MNIRFATIHDLESIVHIYNQAIRAGNATADLKELNTGDKKDWFFEHSDNAYPVYIIEKDNIIAGWGSVSPYRKGREGLRETAEISYYINYRYHNQGLGKALINYMLDDCKRIGIRNVFALLLEINKPSIMMLEKFGFKKWGCMPDVVNLNGTVCSHLIYGRNI